MIRRLAAAMSLLVFAVCLLAGIQVGNDLTTTLGRALKAMAGTLVVALILGAMGQKMLDERPATSVGEAVGDKNAAGLEIPQSKSAR